LFPPLLHSPHAPRRNEHDTRVTLTANRWQRLALPLRRLGNTNDSRHSGLIHQMSAGGPALRQCGRGFGPDRSLRQGYGRPSSPCADAPRRSWPTPSRGDFVWRPCASRAPGGAAPAPTNAWTLCSTMDVSPRIRPTRSAWPEEVTLRSAMRAACRARVKASFRREGRPCSTLNAALHFLRRRGSPRKNM